MTPLVQTLAETTGDIVPLSNPIWNRNIIISSYLGPVLVPLWKDDPTQTLPTYPSPTQTVSPILNTTLLPILAMNEA